MSVIEDVREVLKATLQLGDRANDIEADTPLLGNLPELDSMAVAMLVTSIEEHFDIYIEDDEISAETFETFGALCSFVEEKAA
ncbi:MULTISPECIES: acyl carrier protein [Emcibacter]|jgi:acyl carrier protein|uniref:Acyl carrier protein n=1 Tax=Emcibacter nanhaiensis TaxID=1505037 RepID=A0A501PAS5_9PROT|nr:acyl carrier protein [Emcibacter nanhaiensis]TPD57335.1 acyl carrier protein [Emcibacter nanhaiensis]